MKAIVYTQTGDPSVLRLVERPVPGVGPGEVRVKIMVAGVNPTDIKARERSGAPLPVGGQIPGQDGAGIVDAVGDGVTGVTAGDRVWIWDAAWKRADGTAQEYLLLPAHQAAQLPDNASFDLGASLGIPALTSHRAMTAHRSAPPQLTPGSLRGLTVVVAGGAGVVGHAAIQLAVWAGAAVVATVSSQEKADLARRAGAQHIINYRQQDVAATLKDLHPAGADIIVEVDPYANIGTDVKILAADDGATRMDALSGSQYSSLLYPENQLVSLAPSLLTRGVIDEAALEQRLISIRAGSAGVRGAVARRGRMASNAPARRSNALSS